MEWEISLKKFADNGIVYKVTRRMPALHVAETRFFSSRERALKQVADWSAQQSSDGGEK